MNDAEEVKSRLDIADIIREYVQLKKAGANWKALCPFHNEKSPSFMVSEERQRFHCFGCNKGGDVFTFVQEIEGIDFSEALRLLAERAGVTLKKHSLPSAGKEKERLLECLDLAARFYHKAFFESRSGELARAYVAGRKLSRESIEDFKLGFAPDAWDMLFNFLKKKGFTEREIFNAGLTVERQGRAGYYDRFRKRLMFPIENTYGDTVGFTARLLDPKDTGGKYINTPQTLLYDKSGVIYGLSKAKKAMKDEDLAVLVEGNMDVIASHEAGVKNTVAVSGTALTPAQLALIARFTKNIAFAFDADPAGVGACERSIDLALAEGMNVRIVRVPDGKDPDECIRGSEGGAEKWKRAITEAKSVMEYYFEKAKERYDLGNVEEKKKAGAILLQNIAKVPSKIEQAHWLARLSNFLSVPEPLLREELAQAAASRRSVESHPVKKTVSAEAKSAPEAAAPAAADILGEEIISLALRFPNALPVLLEELLPEMFFHPQCADLYKKIVAYYNSHGSFNTKQFAGELDESFEIIYTRLQLLADKEYGDKADIKEREIRRFVNLLVARYKRAKREELLHTIAEAEAGGDRERVQALMRDFQKFTDLS